MFRLTPIIQVIAAALAIFAIINWLILMLADNITRFIPMRLSPVTTYMEAVTAFGIGAGVYLLAVIASQGHKGGHH